LDQVDRRRFLKYAGATATVVGASALGLNYVSQRSPSTLPPATSATSQVATTFSSSATSMETLRLVSLHGRLFSDYNGNGVQDGEEPPVPDTRVQLKQFQRENSTWKVIYEAISDSASDWKLEDVKTGSYNLVIVTDQKYRHMCTSPAEFTGILRGYDLSLTKSTKMNIGLMEGFHTSPIHKNKSDIISFVDLDPSKRIRDWKGGKQTYDGHAGTDFLAQKGTEVLATAPGRILAAANGWPGNPRWKNTGYYANGNFVVINHGNNIWTAYHHLDSIAVDETPWGECKQDVKRGQVIGYVGKTGLGIGLVPDPNMPYHLHFQNWNGDGFMYGRVDAMDPFRDLYYGKRGTSPWSNPASLWTVDNKIQYPNP